MPDPLRDAIREEAVLIWECSTCGWTCTIPMPGYAGDGYYHYENGWARCGPLVARRAPGFIRAYPGEALPVTEPETTP